MALENTSAASGNTINCGHGSSIANWNTGTAIFSVYLTSVANSGNRILSKAVFQGGWEINRVGADGTKLRAQWYTSTGQTTVDSVTGTLEVNKWAYYAVVFDMGLSGTSGNNIIYEYLPGTGAAKADVTGTISMVGSGSHTDDTSTDMRLMSDANGNNGLGGRLGHMMLFSRRLTSGEIDAQLEHPHLIDDGSCKLFFHVGLNGTGAMPDLSGNGNTGTPSGSLTLADHTPLGRYF